VLVEHPDPGHSQRIIYGLNHKGRSFAAILEAIMERSESNCIVASGGERFAPSTTAGDDNA
jgi:hypothetical protein